MPQTRHRLACDVRVGGRTVLPAHLSISEARRRRQLRQRSSSPAIIRCSRSAATSESPDLQRRRSDRDRTRVSSRLAFDVVCGSVLGDSSLSSRSSILTCVALREAERLRPSSRHRLLEELRPVVDEVARSRSPAEARTAYRSCMMRTRADRALDVLRARVRPAERKVVPAWIAQPAEPRACSRSGSWTTATRGSARRASRNAEIATHGFSDADRRILLAGPAATGPARDGDAAVACTLTS